MPVRPRNAEDGQSEPCVRSSGKSSGHVRSSIYGFSRPRNRSVDRHGRRRVFRRSRDFVYDAHTSGEPPRYASGFIRSYTRVKQKKNRKKNSKKFGLQHRGDSRNNVTVHMDRLLCTRSWGPPRGDGGGRRAKTSFAVAQPIQSVISLSSDAADMAPIMYVFFISDKKL